MAPRAEIEVPDLVDAGRRELRLDRGAQVEVRSREATEHALGTVRGPLDLPGDLFSHLVAAGTDRRPDPSGEPIFPRRELRHAGADDPADDSPPSRVNGRDAAAAGEQHRHAVGGDDDEGQILANARQRIAAAAKPRLRFEHGGTMHLTQPARPDPFGETGSDELGERRLRRGTATEKANFRTARRVAPSVSAGVLLAWRREDDAGRARHRAAL